MKIYLVGGAIRDSLLGLEVLEKDWVVVGSSEEELTKKGYKKIGKDFPVFLHPDTKEEYALARKEKKSGKGHKAFEFAFDATVTLEEDLLRRDLTINAIAQDEEGNLIDPYGGKQDIQKKNLQHVSEAFEEDPLRVLRVARFHAKLKYLDFKISNETLVMMERVSSSGEIEMLSKERFWMEAQKALLTNNPEIFFKTLQEVGALERITNLKILNDKEVRSASKETKDLAVIWSVMIAKNNNIEEINNSFNVPKEVSEISTICNSLIAFQSSEISAELMLNVIQNSDLVRKPERFFIAAKAASYFEVKDSAKNIDWKIISGLLNEIDADVSLKDGKAIAKKLYEDRLNALDNYLSNL